MATNLIGASAPRGEDALESRLSQNFIANGFRRQKKRRYRH